MESTQYFSYKLYSFSPSFLILVGSSFFKFFLANIAELLRVVRADESIWETKIEEIDLTRVLFIDDSGAEFHAD